MSIVHKNCRIAYGCTRTVWLIGNYAFKFPAMVEWRLFLLGLLANMQEKWLSKLGWPELCPVVWSLPYGLLVVMKRAKELTQEECEQFDLKAWLDRGNYLIPAEPKMDSFGWLDGNLVVVDYGN